MRRDWWTFPSMFHKMAYDLMFGEACERDRKLLAVAVKLIRGDREFTPEELQIQANEPERLEQMLAEFKKLMDHEKGGEKQA